MMLHEFQGLLVVLLLCVDYLNVTYSYEDDLLVLYKSISPSAG